MIMSKSRSRDHLGFVRAVLQDCADYYPMLSGGFKRDLSRLESHMREVGDRVFLIDLPAIAKVFDRALADCVLPRTNLPLTAGINSRTTIPRLFQGLWLRVFSLNGCLMSNADPNAIFFLRSLLLGQKKFEKGCSDDVLYETVEEFYRVDHELPPPSRFWDGGDSRDRMPSHDTIYDRIDRVGILGSEVLPISGSTAFRHMLDTVQRVADRISSSLGQFDPSDNEFKHGPGATAEFQRGAGFKYLFPSWSPQLQSVFPREYYAVSSESLLVSGLTHSYDLFDNVDGVEEWGERDHLPPLKEDRSRLIAVPKTQKAPRLIAAEPTANQWCQQNIASFLTKKIRASVLGDSIDFRRQDLSKDLAQNCSLTGELATMDLSSASDRLSCWLVERLFRSNHSILRAFQASRTRFISQDLDKKSPILHRMRKFSSMGSALTFPVQSLSFLMILLGVGSHLSHGKADGWEQLCSKVRVYGDDLIFPVSWVGPVMDVLSYLHLKVNQTKTFSVGNFRESCGMDAWNGSDVTPAYFLKFPDESALGSIASLVASSNNFFRKGLWKTAAWVGRLVPDSLSSLIPIVPIGSGAFGFESYTGFKTNGRIRWNKDLHRREYRTFVNSTKAGTRKHEGFANLLQYFTEDPSFSFLTDWESGVFGRSSSTIRVHWAPVEGLETFVYPE